MTRAKRSFEIRPHEQVGDIHFGMSPENVHAVLGPPEKETENYLGEREELWRDVKVCYGKGTGRVVEVQLMPPAEASFQGVDLMGLKDPVKVLIKADPAPLESVGIILFLKLGIAVTGFGDSEDESDKAVGISAPGRWDDSLEDFRPLRR